MTFENGHYDNFESDFTPEKENYSQFEIDLSRFRAEGDRLLEHMLKAGEGAEEYPLHGNTNTSPFSDLNMLYRLLQERGLRVGFSRETVGGISNSLGVKVHSDDDVIFNKILREYIPGNLFISQVTKGMTSSALDGIQDSAKILNFAGTFSDEEGRSRISPEQVDDLVKRCFMTSTLLNKLWWEGRREPSFDIFTTAEEQYELLSGEGYRPLGTEELYGIINGALTRTLAHLPDVAEELKTRQENRFS